MGHDSEKREAYREAFDQFDPKKVARYTAKRIEELLTNDGIVRNRLKVESAVSNAKAFRAVQKEYGTFDEYVWQFVGGAPKQNTWKLHGQVPATSTDSDTMSKDLVKRGFRFVGQRFVRVDAGDRHGERSFEGMFRFKELDRAELDRFTK